MNRLYWVVIWLFIAACSTIGHCATGLGIDASQDRVAVRSGRQSLTVGLGDASLIFDCPAGKIELNPEIEYPDGGKLLAAEPAPKTYQGRDSVAALIVFPTTDGRKLRIHLDAYAGIDGVFVTSSLTASFSGNRDYFRWISKDAFDRVKMGNGSGVESTLPSESVLRCKDWAWFPLEDGGVSVYTNGVVGFVGKSPFIEALPRYRYLRSEETLDIGIGFTDANNYARAISAFNSARSRNIPALTRKKTVTKEYGTPAPKWLSIGPNMLRWGDEIEPGSVVLGVPAQQAAIDKVHDKTAKAIVRLNLTHLSNPHKQNEADPDGLLDIEKHPDWACIGTNGEIKKSAQGTLSCLHQPDLREALLTVVCNVMNLGADGLLLDGVVPIPDCSSPKFSRHEHPHSSVSNTNELDNLCGEIYKLVKSIGRDKVVLLNSGAVASLWPVCDGQSWDVLQFDEIERAYAAEEHSEALRRGKTLLALPLLKEPVAAEKEKTEN